MGFNLEFGESRNPEVLPELFEKRRVKNNLLKSTK
jgi:hypothetical protein